MIDDEARTSNIPYISSLIFLYFSFISALFEPSHMLYEHEKGQYGAGEPTLPEMVEFAVKVLEKNPKGYILFVEGVLR